MIPHDEPSQWQVRVFYDGDCPLCAREIRMLAKRDRKHRRIWFTNIADSAFDAQALGKTQDELMAQIHGWTRDGEWIDRVEVFRRLYDAVGLGWLVGITRLPGISHAAEWGYDVFARNRLRWTGRQ